MPGTYFVTVTETCGASQDTIVVSEIPPVDLGNDSAAVCIGNQLLLDAATANATYFWSDGSSSSSLAVSTAGTYWVIITTANCPSTDSVIVTTEECDAILILPNVFTPNTDGNNDSFIPVLSKGIVAVQSSIYNRWGELVYTSTDVSVAWNGKINGNDADDGVYYWTLNYTDRNGNTGDFKGFVTLLR